MNIPLQNRSAQKPPTGKFDGNETRFKVRVKQMRLDRGIRMGEAAAIMGMTRKQLEDLETLRDYGCYINLKHIYQFAEMLGVEPWELLQ